MCGKPAMGGQDAANDGGRVTTAVLVVRLDTIERLLREQTELLRSDHDRIAVLEGQILRLSERLDSTNSKIGMLQIGQAALTAIGSAIASWLGMRN